MKPIRLEKKQIFVWAAIDTKECLAVWASEGRSSFHAYVLKEVLKCCENKPEVVVDRGFWNGL